MNIRGCTGKRAHISYDDALVHELNRVPKRAARVMERHGYPPDWLASRRPVPLSRCHAVEVFYRTEWGTVSDLSPTDFDAYLAERRQEEAIAQQAAARAVAITPVRRTAAKMGRNEVCSCGSGRKFKHCCGAASNLSA